MTKKQKKMLIRILVAAALMLILRFVPLPLSGVSMFLLWLIPYFIIGYDIDSTCLKFRIKSHNSQ